jgi:hypothetical protein
METGFPGAGMTRPPIGPMPIMDARTAAMRAQAQPWLSANPGATHGDFLQAQNAWTQSPQYQQWQNGQNSAFGNWWGGLTDPQRAAYINNGTPMGVSGLSPDVINQYSSQGGSSPLANYGAQDLQSMNASLAAMRAGLAPSPTMPTSFTGADMRGQTPAYSLSGPQPSFASVGGGSDPGALGLNNLGALLQNGMVPKAGDPNYNPNNPTGGGGTVGGPAGGPYTANTGPGTPAPGLVATVQHGMPQGGGATFNATGNSSGPPPGYSSQLDMSVGGDTGFPGAIGPDGKFHNYIMSGPTSGQTSGGVPPGLSTSLGRLIAGVGNPILAQPNASMPSTPLPGTAGTSFALNPSAYMNPMESYLQDWATHDLSSAYGGAGDFLSGAAGRGIAQNAANIAANTSYLPGLQTAQQQQQAGIGLGEFNQQMQNQLALENQTIPFNQQMQLAQLGLSGAQGQSQINQIMAMLQAQLAQSAGTAGGTGTVAGTNAINNAISQFISNAMGIPNFNFMNSLAQLYGNRPTG